MSSKESILHKIADYLARRDHSPKEILDKLERKKVFTTNEILSGIKKAQDAGWFLPDDELALKVHAHLVRKGKSHKYIEQYLKTKGLPSTAFDRSEEVQTIRRHLEKKFQTFANLEYDDKQKVLRSLAQKGFDLSCCYEALRLEANMESMNEEF